MVRQELFRHDLEFAHALGIEYSLVPRVAAVLEPFKRQIEQMKQYLPKRRTQARPPYNPRNSR